MNILVPFLGWSFQISAHRHVFGNMFLDFFVFGSTVFFILVSEAFGYSYSALCADSVRAVGSMYVMIT